MRLTNPKFARALPRTSNRACRGDTRLCVSPHFIRLSFYRQAKELPVGTSRS